MKSYTKPDFVTDIAHLCEHIERDYRAMCDTYSLSPELSFEKVVAAVFEGGLGNEKQSPYQLLVGRLIDELGNRGLDDVHDCLETLSGVWNHFPHKDLQNLAPIEKMRKEHGGQRPADGFLSGDADVVQQTVDELILSFDKAVRENLWSYLKDVGFTHSNHEHILNILRDPKVQPDEALQYLLLRFLEIAKKSNQKKSFMFDDIQPLVRAVSWCENHTASKMTNGHYNCRMFQYIVQQSVEYNSKVLEAKEGAEQGEKHSVYLLDPVSAFQGLSVIHANIGRVSDDGDIDPGLEEAARHVTDWLALTNIHKLLEHDTYKTTLFMFAVAHRIATVGDPRKLYKRDGKKLRRLFSEYDDTNEELDTTTEELARFTLEAAGDPVMLMPYPGKEPAKCIENLYAIAPALKLRIQLDPDNLPIPSPFM